MNDAVRRVVTGGVAIVVPVVMLTSWMGSAESRLEEKARTPAENKVAIASLSEDSYCTPELKAIVRRVAGACGLLDQSGGRGCQPATAKNVAQLSDTDFNALFLPLAKRASIIQYDPENIELDEPAKAAIEKAWADQRGASFFFVVARASPDGDEKINEELSAGRAQSVLAHLQVRFNDPELKKEVGLLWLGEGFAQLGEEFCMWQRSRTGQECTAKEINRSAFVAWIDCAI